jgi:hypothetical protein
MRVRWHVGEQAYSKIAFAQACERQEILRLPCRATLQDGRAGGISMSLDFLFLFDQAKRKEENYDPVIARFFSPDNFVQIPEFTQSFNRYSYCLNNPLSYTDPTGQLWNPVYDMGGKFLGVTSEGFEGIVLIYSGKIMWNGKI